MIRVTTEPLDIAQHEKEVADPRAGAVVSFAGVVRDHDHGRAVTALTYEAHPSAEEVLREVAAEIASDPDVYAVAVSHRYGPLADRRGRAGRGGVDRPPGGRLQRLRPPGGPGQAADPDLEASALRRRQRGVGQLPLIGHRQRAAAARAAMVPSYPRAACRAVRAGQLVMPRDCVQRFGWWSPPRVLRCQAARVATRSAADDLHARDGTGPNAGSAPGRNGSIATSRISAIANEFSHSTPLDAVGPVGHRRKLVLVRPDRGDQEQHEQRHGRGRVPRPDQRREPDRLAQPVHACPGRRSRGWPCGAAAPGRAAR